MIVIHQVYELWFKLVLREMDLLQKAPESAEARNALVHIYRNDPKIRDPCERLVDLDEGIQERSYRHVRMVERTMGAKQGTGGSSGAQYLKSTLLKALLPDLWTIRAEL